MLERRHLCSANSFRGPGHTYFGNVAGVKSRIDHICIPQSLLPCILSCAVMYTLGERLQRVFGPGKRDHMPVNLILQHHSHFSGSTSSQRCVWNTSRLVDGVTGGLSWCTGSTNDWMTHIWHNMQHFPLHKRFPILTRFGLPFGKQYESLLARCIPNNKPNSLKGHATPWQQYKDIKMLGQVLLPSLEVLFKFATVVILTSFCRRFSFNGKHLFIFLLRETPGTSCSNETSVNIWPIVLLNLIMQYMDMMQPMFGNWDACCQATRWGQNAEGMTNHRPADQKPLTGYNICLRQERMEVVQRKKSLGKQFNTIPWLLITHLFAHINKLIRWLWPICTVFFTNSAYISCVALYLNGQFLVKFGGSWLFRMFFMHLADWVWDIVTRWTTLCFAHVCTFCFCQSGCMILHLWNGISVKLFKSTKLMEKLVAPASEPSIHSSHWEKHMSSVFGKRASDRAIDTGLLATYNTSHASPLSCTGAFSNIDCELWDRAIVILSMMQLMLSPVLYGVFVTKLLIVHVDAAMLTFLNNETIQQYSVYRQLIQRCIFVMVQGLCKGMDMPENNSWNSITPQLITGWIHWARQSRRIFWYMILFVNNMSTHLFPHTLTIWRELWCVTQCTNWCTNCNMLTESFVRYWILLVLLKIWTSKNMYLVLWVATPIATPVKFLQERSFLVKPVLLLVTWVLCTTSVTMIVLKSTTECKKLILDGMQWVSSGFGKDYVELPLFLFLKEWCIQLSCLDWKRCVCHTLMLIAWTNTYSNEVENSCMVPRATSSPLRQVQNTRLSRHWKFGGFLYMVPARIELRIRRLKFWQNAAKFPEKYSLLFACLFGQFDFEQHCSIDGSGKPTATANPWLRQFATDIDALGELDSGTFLASQVQGRVLLIFSTFREDFLRIDVTEFRAKFLGHEIPPPEWVPPTLDPQEVFLVPDDTPYVCNLLCADGSMCNQKFATQVQLSAHILHSRGGDHGRRPIYSLAAVSNICPWCRCKYSTRVSASHHIKASFERGQCTGKGSAFNPGILPPKSLQCPVCQEERHSTDDLLQHIAAHDTPAAFFARQNQ